MIHVRTTLYLMLWVCIFNAMIQHAEFDLVWEAGGGFLPKQSRISSHKSHNLHHFKLQSADVYQTGVEFWLF